jgi:hypothetical protein
VIALALTTTTTIIIPLDRKSAKAIQAHKKQLTIKLIPATLQES